MPPAAKGLSPLESHLETRGKGGRRCLDGGCKRKALPSGGQYRWARLTGTIVAPAAGALPRTPLPGEIYQGERSAVGSQVLARNDAAPGLNRMIPVWARGGVLRGVHCSQGTAYRLRGSKVLPMYPVNL